MLSRWMITCLLIVTFLLSGIALGGYILERPGWYTWSSAIGMAPNTAIALIALAVAGLCHLMDHVAPYDEGKWDD